MAQTQFCDNGVVPAAFYSHSLRWTLLRAALLALLAFVGLDLWLDAWLAAVLAMLAGGLHVVDATRARRADARSSSAETIVSR